MQNCLNCRKETKNPKYCSQSCSAAVNNKLSPKREKTRKCKNCDKMTYSKLTYCSNKCYKIMTKKQRDEKPQSNRSKFCPSCGIEKNEENSFNRRKERKTQQTHSYCKQCNAKLSAERARKFKRECVDYKGGKCEFCGYNKCNGALEFHHLDPNEKDFTIGQQRNRKMNDTIKKEIDKCLLLCSNCHKEEHYRLSKLKNDFLS